MPFSTRVLLFFGGLTGAAGVMLAAAAYHSANPVLQSAALICLANGPALIGLSLLARSTPVALAAGLVMTLGTVLFAGDLLSASYLGQGLFRMSAPIGGSAVIAGWLIAALAALLPAGRK